MIPANTSVFDWFQYGGNNDIVEAINLSSTPEAQTALTTTASNADIVAPAQSSAIK